MLLWAFLSHYTACGLLCPISSFLGILGQFFNSTFPWAFTYSLGLSCPNYHILHLWGSWVFHQLLIFSLHYFGPAMIHSHFSTSHNTYAFTISFSGLLCPSASFKAHLLILRAYNPLFLPFRLNGSSNHLLTLLCPYCWVSFCYWASKWASTTFFMELSHFQFK